MTRAGAAARFRQRKLSTKHQLAVVREDQVEKVDDDAQRNIPKVDTGVEKGEEIEHHLQAAISASQAAAVGGKVAQIYIPTPDTIASTVNYDQLYSLQFSQPATYIRFSSTVEDCSGCPYCMSGEDAVYLKSMNQKKSASTQCSEDQFEEVMNFFEETAQSKQPFAAVDNPPVVTYDEMESSFDETIDDHSRPFAKGIYEHWKSQRLKKGNLTLMSNLKFETGQDTDDADPYVCFRRREVRQVRKTRGRDAQSTEKLKKLRKELEDARELVAMVKQREMTRKEMLAVDRLIFEQRTNVKEAKRKLGIKADDEDLINQKPQKRKIIEPSQGQRQSLTSIRPAARLDGRPAEMDLISLQEMLVEKENLLQRQINEKVEQHRKWNEGYIDMTRTPLTPTLEQSTSLSFRTAVNEYLPTPPASVSSEHSVDAVYADENSPSRGRDDSIAVRYVSPTYDGPDGCQPSFRRRVGRGGRLMIDRRGMRLQSKEGIDPAIIDRYKYDDDDEDEIPTYNVDPYDVASIRLRASMYTSPQHHAAFQAAQTQAARRSQQDVPMVNGHLTAGQGSSPCGPANPSAHPNPGPT
ncbi:MAG: Enhancer of polycomb-like protein 1 [Pycnora praestabilis]|nr:MAG: Enhancer of polycomb-like protein 1 [Pycnora praestabilis]